MKFIPSIRIEHEPKVLSKDNSCSFKQTKFHLKEDILFIPSTSQAKVTQSIYTWQRLTQNILHILQKTNDYVNKNNHHKLSYTLHPEDQELFDHQKEVLSNCSRSHVLSNNKLLLRGMTDNEKDLKTPIRTVLKVSSSENLKISSRS